MRIIIFDGVCNLCAASVGFVIRRDRRARFRFAAAQSAAGRALQDRYRIDAMEDGTVLLLRDGRVFARSDAALEIARELDGAWRALAWLRVIPRTLRDPVYVWVARNRYRWFGKRASCLLPDPGTADRFLNADDDAG